MNGIKNISEKVTLDFYKKTLDRSFDPADYRIKGIYGENGSGKTALVTAVVITKALIMFPNFLMQDATRSFLDEMINRKTQKFEAEMEYLVENTGKGEEKRSFAVYRYQITVEKKEKGNWEITREQMSKKNGNYSNSTYSDLYLAESGNIEKINCKDPEISERIKQKSMNLLRERTFISYWVFEEEGKGEINFNHDLFEFMTRTISIQTYICDEDQHLSYITEKFKEISEKKIEDLKKNVEVKMLNLIFRDVIGTDSKKIWKYLYPEYERIIKKLERFIQIFKTNLKSIDIDRKEDGDYYRCELNMNYGEYRINQEFESTGIRKLMKLFNCLNAAAAGQVVFIDEFDANINDVYLNRMIEFFMYYGEGQLCFTSHNIDPMSILNQNKLSIAFLSAESKLKPWVQSGNASPENYYKNGAVEGLPFNVEASDFIGILGR